MPKSFYATIAERVCQRVVELPDRTSPADWPEAMLVTRAELWDIVFDELRDARTVTAGHADGSK